MLSWLTCIFLIRFNILCCAFRLIMYANIVFTSNFYDNMCVCVCAVCCVVHCSIVQGSWACCNMEKRNRNKIIIIIIIWHVSYFICLAIPGKWTCNLECFQLPVPSFCLTDLPLPLITCPCPVTSAPLLLAHPHLFSWVWYPVSSWIDLQNAVLCSWLN